MVNNESDRFIEQDFNLRRNFYCLPNFPISLLNKETQGSSGTNRPGVLKSQPHDVMSVACLNNPQHELGNRGMKVVPICIFPSFRGIINGEGL